MSEPLANAIECGNSVAVRLLIRSVDINKRFDWDTVARGSTPLIYAIQYQQLEIVEILLQANADIDQTDSLGRTACHAAVLLDEDNNCEGSNSETFLSHLLPYRPNLTLRDRNHYTALEHAMLLSSERIVWLLIDAGAPLEYISGEASCSFAGKSKEAIYALQRCGIAIDQLYFDGTPLHQAVYNHNSDTSVFDTLVNVCGVEIEAHDNCGDTCAHLAAERGNACALDWLVRAGANVSARNQFANGSNFTPLHLTGDYNCALILIAAGVDVNAVDWYGNTVIHRAAYFERDNSNFMICRALLAAGANLDISNHHGITARERLLERDGMKIDKISIDAARRDITKKRLDFVRHRAMQVCLALHHLPALQICEILLFSCGPIAPVVSFHHWWKIATTVKHFSVQP
jgi:ankyrin repeat protein